MTRRSIRPARRIGASLAALAVAGVFLPTGSQAVSADDGNVDVINTETVQIYMDADGNVDTKRIYEQLSMTGKGSVNFGNPIEPDGLRNLDGFEGFDVKDGEQQVDMDVDGVAHVRTVSDDPGDLPLDVNVKYNLDGKSVKAADVVGYEGEL
jgi:putative membrane protein